MKHDANRDDIFFPPVETANPDGILAVGGDLSTDRLLKAYQSGIFPWYNDGPVVWWYPDPRFVLFPDQLIVSASMKRLLKKKAFTITINKRFEQVICYCRSVSRKDQQGTWINHEMEEAYIQLHKKGYGVSVEAWQEDKLVGGLYGVRLGQVFFGESMFSLVSNASKAAFISYVYQLKMEKVMLIDCQVYTDHLASLGALSIPAKQFKQLLESSI